MNKVYERINWENEPSIATPLGASNLNKTDYAINEIDNRVIVLDTEKANQVDELLDIKEVSYNPTTGVWTFTHQNGTIDTFDQNIEKIPVSFSMDENGVITMTTADGTTYTCDVGTLIKTITFVNSGNIQFTVTTDTQGNKSVTANIIDGSVTRAKLDPDYLAQIDLDVASASASATAAGGSATTASNKALDSEAYAVGTRGGVPVTSDDPAYENNSKYYAEHGASSLAGLTDVNIRDVTNGQVIKYNSATQKWENDDESGGGGGILPHLIVISETGSTVTATKGQTVITATETSTGHFECDLPEFGTWTIDAILGGDDAQVSLVVDTVKVYTVDDSHFHASVTVTYPIGAACGISGQGETYYATTDPYTFTVHHTGTYTLTCTLNNRSATKTVTITTDGQTESVTFTIEDIYDGSTITPVNDIQTWLNCANIFDKSYTTLNEVLADSSTLQSLISSQNACDYLVRSTSWVNGICANQTAMSYIGLNNYCANTLLADSDWRNGIANSQYYDSVLIAHIPTMTSNTTPSGTASATSVYSGFEAYKSFNKDDSDGAMSSSTQNPPWEVKYTFASPITNAYRLYYKIITTYALTNYSAKIQLLNSDTNSWEDLISLSGNKAANSSEYGIIDFNKQGTYSAIRYYLSSVGTSTSSGGKAYGIRPLELDVWTR